MAESQASSNAPEAAVEVADGEASLLDSILSKVEVKTPSGSVRISEFKDQTAVAEKDRGAMVSAALRVFMDAIVGMETSLDKIDKFLLDSLIASIDEKIST